MLCRPSDLSQSNFLPWTKYFVACGEVQRALFGAFCLSVGCSFLSARPFSVWCCMSFHFSFPHISTSLPLCLHSHHRFCSIVFLTISFAWPPHPTPSSKPPPPVDVWSVGCIVAEMIRGSVLFPGTDRILVHHRFMAVSSLHPVRRGCELQIIVGFSIWPTWRSIILLLHLSDNKRMESICIIVMCELH